MKKEKRIFRKKKCPTVRGHAGTSSNSKRFYDNSPIAQQARILDWFLNKSPRLSTLQAREELGIMSPACRIMELRDKGHIIALEWKRQVDVTGTPHRAGVYIYMGNSEPHQSKEALVCHA